MKIGIISDTHGDAVAWKKALDNCFQEVDLIIHAGDVLYHGPRNPIISSYGPANLVELLHQAPVPLLIARGNCDAEVDSMVLERPMTEQVVMQVGKRLVIAQHGHRLAKGEAGKLACSFKADLWITGHTHIPTLEVKEGIIFINPGSPSLPHEGPMGRIKSVAVADDSGVRLLDLDTGKKIKEIPWPV